MSTLIVFAPILVIAAALAILIAIAERGNARETRTRRVARATRQLVVLAATASLAVGCGGSGNGGGPTASSGPQAALQTPYGTVTVYTNGNAFDADRALAAIEAGYSKARGQVGSRIDGVRLDGLAISVQPGVFNSAVGQYVPGRDQVEIAAGVENVLTHELQHRFCHKLGRSGNCCTLQDHSGGFDLECRPQ